MLKHQLSGGCDKGQLGRAHEGATTASMTSLGAGQPLERTEWRRRLKVSIAVIARDGPAKLARYRLSDSFE